jgi:hypothetical protein
VPAEDADPTARRLLELAGSGLTLAALSLELRRSEFETAELAFRLHGKGLLSVVAPRSPGTKAESDPVGIIQSLLAEGAQRLGEHRFELALQAYEQALSLDRLNQNAKKGLVATIEARDRRAYGQEGAARQGAPPDHGHGLADRQNFDPQEGFVLSRVNGMWDVGSILKLCPMNESDVLLIFARLLERKVIELD